MASRKASPPRVPMSFQRRSTTVSRLFTCSKCVVAVCDAAQVQDKKEGHLDGRGQCSGALSSHSIVPQVQVGDCAVKLQQSGELLHHLDVAQGADPGCQQGDGGMVVGALYR